jgi:hypothetical protein
MTDPTTPAPSAITVPVKSAMLSKVNWIAGLGAVAASLSELTPFVPPAYQHYVTVAIIVLTGVVTIYTKTFQTTSITPSSAAKV